MNVTELLRALGEHVPGNVATVFGQPVTAEGRTIVPVARVRWLFGAGGGGGELLEKHKGEGGGGGGGMLAKPVGVFEISATGTRFISVADKRRMAAALALGFVTGALLARRRG